MGLDDSRGTRARSPLRHEEVIMGRRRPRLRHACANGNRVRNFAPDRLTHSSSEAMRGTEGLSRAASGVAATAVGLETLERFHKAITEFRRLAPPLDEGHPDVSVFPASGIVIFCFHEDHLPFAGDASRFRHRSLRRSFVTGWKSRGNLDFSICYQDLLCDQHLRLSCGA